MIRCTVGCASGQICMSLIARGKCRDKFACLMMFNTTFNNISVISWRSVLLVEETGGPGENQRPVASQ